MENRGEQSTHTCVMVPNSIVLKIEQMVALYDIRISCGSLVVGYEESGLRNTQQKDGANAPLRLARQLNLRQIDEWRSHVDDIGKDVADTLCIGEPQSSMRPTLPGLVAIVPICFKGCAAEKRQHGREEVESCDKRNRQPHDALVHLGKIEYQ